MGDRLKGRVAIVTGAGGGIGRGEALTLASEGAYVVINDMGAALDGSGGEASPAEKVVQEIKAMGGQAVANHDNIVETETGEKLVKLALDNWGRLDIIVNNAGILRDRMIFNMTPEDWDAVIAVHLRGHFNVTKPACAYFRQERKGGVIINTASTSGLGNAGQSNYAAAKEGIVGFTRTLAREMGRYGVRANAIRPQAATRMTLSPDMRARFERAGENGLRALAEIEKQVPEQVGPMVAWLCSDEAANVNGRNFLVRYGFIGLYSEPEIVASVENTENWTVDSVAAVIPEKVTKGLVNEWPIVPPKE